jgi:hypothetical protein
MNSKTACIFLAILLANFIAPLCTRAQIQTLADHVSESPFPPYLGDTTSAAPAWNSIYLEGGGSAVAYSLNYERLLSNKLGLRIGFGYLPVSNSTGTKHASITSAPLTLNWFPFSDTTSSSKLEIGAGLSYVDLTKAAYGFAVVNTIGYTAIVGYRYQPWDGGFLFRIAFTPVIIAADFHAWGGISFGYGF